MKRIEPPAMSLTAQQLETVRAMQRANTEFWITPDANLVQKELAKLQSKIAVQAGHDHKRGRGGGDAHRKLGDKTRELVRAEWTSLTRPGSRANAAKWIAPKVRDRLKNKTTPSVERVIKILKELGLPPRKTK